ncbi:MAG: Cytoskeleton protein RodZ [Gammaproteobacteria bacterium]|nr:Cytoskeleton protein RodZ [Gammaproteobacteria bacterium]
MKESGNTVDVMTCGRLLRCARERQRLSVDDVALELRLSNFQIRALEDDDWDRLPGITYVRGYLRSYARLLDVDIENLLEGASEEGVEDFRTENRCNTGGNIDESDAVSAYRPPWGWIIGVLAISVLALFLWYSKDRPQWVTGVATGVGTPTGSEVVGRRDEGVSDTRTSGESLGIASGDSSLSTGIERIVLRTEERAWVDIRDARGERLLYRAVEPDRRIEVEGLPPFRVFLGNARAVRIGYSQEIVTPNMPAGRLYTRFVLGAPSG